MTTKIPSGYEQYSLPGMGQPNREIFDMLKGQFMQGGGDVFKNLLSLAKGDTSAMQGLEKYGMDVFQQQIAPGIAQRYAGSGIGSSSGMQNAIAGAGGNLASQLQSKRTDLMQQSMRDVLGLGNMLLGTPTEHFGLVQKENILRDIMQLLGGAGAQIGGMFGGSKLAGIL
jgi:hypothetical protein